jgi:hypothetical protein
VNADKTKYMIMTRDQKAGRSHCIKIDTSSFEKVEQFKYLGKNLKNKKSIQEESKSRLKSGNASCHLEENLLSSSLLSKSIKTKDIQNYNFVCFLYGCETWSRILKEERRLKVFENRVLRRIFGPKRDGITGE